MGLARLHLRRKAVGQMRLTSLMTAVAASAKSQIRRKLRAVLSLAKRPQLPMIQVAEVKARNARRNPLQSSAELVLVGDEAAVETTLMVVVSVIRERSPRALVRATAVIKTDHQNEIAHQTEVEPLPSGREGVTKAATIVDADDLDEYWEKDLF